MILLERKTLFTVAVGPAAIISAAAITGTIAQYPGKVVFLSKFHKQKTIINMPETEAISDKKLESRWPGDRIFHAKMAPNISSQKREKGE
jgi:hypothetical protein